MKDAAKTLLASLLTLAVPVLVWAWFTRPGGLSRSVLRHRYSG